jgi:hypothetical protein
VSSWTVESIRVVFTWNFIIRSESELFNSSMSLVFFEDFSTRRLIAWIMQTGILDHEVVDIRSKLFILYFKVDMVSDYEVNHKTMEITKMLETLWKFDEFSHLK